MNQEFLDFYNAELKLLYEQAADYAAEFQGVAERLGGLTADRMDPGLVGLLEGSAFLAARVQLKLKSEFGEFTSALLDQLIPNYLAPIPSFALVQAEPQYENPNLVKGITHKAGAYIDAIYVERERRVSCRYRLGSDLTLWPLRLEKAEYFAGPAPLQAIGLEVMPTTTAGLRLSFLNRSAGPQKDPKTGKPPGHPLSKLGIDRLPIHLVGPAGDVNAIYEQLFANCRRIMLRYEDSQGDPHFVPVPPQSLRQIGFGESDSLYPADQRVFAGFDILRDYFVFPNRFAGFEIAGLNRLLSSLSVTGFDLLFEFDSAIPRLAPLLNRSMFALYAATAANLFEMQCTRIPLTQREHEHQVIPDRSKGLDYEAHRIVDVYAHYQDRKEKIPVFPLYSLPTTDIPLDDALYYTTRRMMRIPTERERRFGTQSTYTGTETFLSLFEPDGLDARDRAKELSVRALVSNRHLTEQLPVGDTGADFRMSDDTALDIRCIAGPTPPLDSLVHGERRHREATHPGPTMWKLINLLSLNHLGLADRSADDRAGGLRELLSLFADITDGFTERQVRGVESVATRPIVRRLRQPSGFNAARGMEITVTLDEKAFENSGVVIFGAVLDRFFSEYTSINSFTETVIATSQRGVIVRWPPRSGLGGVL
jgi:type VI secretion system protein ImpG